MATTDQTIYYDFVNVKNEDEFNAYVEKCKELALYDTGVTAEYGDRLITLTPLLYRTNPNEYIIARWC